MADETNGSKSSEDNFEKPEIARDYDVFISYARADNDNEVLTAADLRDWLESLGYAVWMDTEMNAGVRWKKQLRVKIESSRKVVALFSPNSLASEMCRFEVNLADTDDDDKKLVPFVIIDLDKQKFPGHLDHINYRKMESFEAEKAQILASLGAPMGEAKVEIDYSASNIPLDILDLPSPGGILIGRGEEKLALRQAWASTAPGTSPREKTNIIVLHAIGGAGKSALMRDFVDDLTSSGFEGAEAVYGWSAYSQGSGDNRNADADGFINNALKFFGYDINANPITDATDKGRKLAELVAAKRALLVLDGLEPLQEVPVVNKGRLKSPAMVALVKSLSAQNKGLLLITSRQELPELENCRTPQVINHELNQLSVKEGVELLAHYGVHGKRAEMEKAVKSVLGHALSLNLLGSYLDTVHGGDINQREVFDLESIQDADADYIGDKTERYAKRAGRVIEGYLARFEDMRQMAIAEDKTGGGVAETAILRMIGLFDRPVDGELVDLLLKEPVIAGLTDKFAGKGKTRKELAGYWSTALSRLRKLKLVAKANPKAKGQIDAHPIVRAHFAAELEHDHPNAWQQANDRLYQYYKNLPEEAQPDTLDEMQPLFHAIMHGVRAGHVQEVFDDVYWQRISRGNEAYLVHKLGAVNALLNALSHFFLTPSKLQPGIKPWQQPHPDLALADQAVSLNMAGFALRALGRLREAVVPMEASGSKFAELDDWENAASVYGTVSELQLTLGGVQDAVAAASQAITSAKKIEPENLFQQMGGYVYLATAHHQAGDRGAARSGFQTAETLQKKRQPDVPHLYSTAGFYYCDLLLDQGQGEEVEGRAAYAHEIAQRNNWVLHISLDTLSHGRAAHLHMRATQWQSTPGDTQETLAKANAAKHLGNAVSGLRKAGREDHLSRGLLARSAFCRDTANYAQARTDLEDTEEIINRGDMRLFQVEHHLETARLMLAEHGTKNIPDVFTLAMAHPDADHQKWLAEQAEIKEAAPDAIETPIEPGSFPKKQQSLLGRVLTSLNPFANTTKTDPTSSSRRRTGSKRPSTDEIPAVTQQALPQSLFTNALNHVSEAEKLIKDTGYHRRDEEAAMLRSFIEGVKSD